MIHEMDNTYCVQTHTANLHFVLKLPTLIVNASMEPDFDCGKVTNSSRSTLHTCRVARPLLNSLHLLKSSMTSTTRQELTRILEMTQSFDHDRSLNTQSKRAILAPVGRFLGGILGLATSDHVEEIKETLRHMYDLSYRSAKSLDATGKTVSKIIVAQNRRLEVLHELLQTEHNISRTLYHDFNRFGLNFDISTQLIGQSIRYIAQYIENLEHINSMKFSLHELIRGHLTDELIPRELVLAELDALQQQLGTTMTVCHQDASYYYRISSVRAFRSNESLIISLPVALSHFNEKFRAIRVITVPLPIHNAGSGYMEIDLQKTTLLYSANAGVYIEVETPLTDTGIIPYEQQAFQTLQPAAASTCIEAIIMHQGDQLTDLCQFQYYHNTLPKARITRLDNANVLLMGISEVKLSCSGQDELIVKVDQVSAVLKVDCNCDLRTKTLFLPAISANCSLSRPRLPKIVYNFNNLLLKSLFDKQKLSDLSEIQLHDSPLDVDIPEVQFTRFEEDLAMDSQQSLTLNQLANNIANQSTIYGDLSSYVYAKVVDAMLSNTAERNDFSLLNYQSWLTVISLTFGVSATIFCIYLSLKLRAIGVLILAGNQVARAQGESLTRTLRLTPRPTATTGMSVGSESIFTNLTYRTFVTITDQHVSEGLLLVLIWLTLTFMTAMILYHMYKRPQFGPLTDLFLRISSENNEVIVYWGNFRFAPGSYRVKKSRPLGSLQLNKLKLKFITRIGFLEKDTGHENRISTYHYISPWQARGINRIMRHGSYTLSLIVTNSSRTITQTIHENIVKHTSRINAGYSGGRVTTRWTPQPQLPAATELETNGSQTGVADAQTETVSQSITQPRAPPPATQHGVGRGAVIRQILNR